MFWPCCFLEAQGTLKLGGKKGPKARALLIDRKWRLVTEKRDFSELVTNQGN